MGKVSKALNKAQSPLKPDNTPPTSVQTQEFADRKTVRNKKGRRVTIIEPNSLPPSGSIEDWNERLIQSKENFSGVAESFRKLRTKILYPETGPPPRSMMMLSSDPQEGKSFVCGNLGVSLANSVEHQALMVDCDLRRSSLQGLFGLQGRKGLTNYLRDGDSLSSLIVKTGYPKLSIIPAGPSPDNPAELISSEVMSAMIKELTYRYDDRLLLLDTPAFHAASETLVLSQLVDKIILVVRWGKPGRENVKKMIDLVGREKIIGIVFNAFEMNIIDRKVQGVGYHNYYPESYYQ